MKRSQRNLEPTIEVSNLSKKYAQKVVLDITNLLIDAGTIVGLVGPNGSGKSTFLRILKGGLYPTSGDVIIGGYSLKRNPDVIRGMTGLAHEEPILVETMTGRQFLRFIGALYYLKTHVVDQEIESWAKKLYMLEHIDRNISEYSHGMRIRLSQIGAVLHNPSVLLLDEPAEGLDPDTVYDVIGALVTESAEKGRTVILSSHRLDIVERYCSRVVVIRNGKIIEDTSPGMLKETYNAEEFEDAYLKTKGNKE